MEIYLLHRFYLRPDVIAQDKQIPWTSRFKNPERLDRSQYVQKRNKKKPTTKGEWQELIDARWGPGLPTEQKLQIFDSYWNRIDQQFASLCEQVYDNRSCLPGRAGVYRHKL